MNIYKLILETDSYTLLKIYYKALFISEGCTDNYFPYASILCLVLLFRPILCSRNLNQPHEQEDFYGKGFRLQKSRCALRGLNLQVFAATALHISQSVFNWTLQAFDCLPTPTLTGFSPKLTSSAGAVLFQDVDEGPLEKNSPLSYAKFRGTRNLSNQSRRLLEKVLQELKKREKKVGMHSNSLNSTSASVSSTVKVWHLQRIRY